MAATVKGTFTAQAPVHSTLRRRRKEPQGEFDMDDTTGAHAIKTPDIPEWDPRSLPGGFFLVFEGKRRTGKSTFAVWLLQHYINKFSLVWVMTNTRASGYWQKYVGDAFTFPSWNPVAVEKMIERNDTFVKKYGEDSPEAQRLGSSLIILDDVISSRIHDDPMFTRLAVEGRHHLISIILMTQDPKAIGPMVRDNCDVAVIFNQKTFRNKESVWHDFMNDTTKDFALAMLSRYAQEHNCLVSVQTNLSSDIQKTFFKSTGDKTKLAFPDYILGGKEQREVVQEERDKKRYGGGGSSAQPPRSPKGARSLTSEEILRD
jgi:hypothetical protein